MTDDITALVERKYLVMKRGLYWRPNDCGYTGIKAQAGRYSLEEAKAREHPENEPVTYVAEDEAPDYAPQCFDDVRADDLAKRLTAAQARMADSEQQCALELGAMKARLAEVEKERDEWMERAEAAHAVVAETALKLAEVEKERDAARAAAWVTIQRVEKERDTARAALRAAASEFHLAMLNDRMDFRGLRSARDACLAALSDHQTGERE